MRRNVVVALFALAISLSAVDEADVLAAARAASSEYQARFRMYSANLDSANETERLEAMRVLTSLQDPQAVPLLMKFLETAKRSVTEISTACAMLGRLGYQTPVGQLRQLTQHEDASVRQSAILALHQIGVLNAGDWMQRAKDEDDSLHLNAVVNLGHLAHADASATLIAGLSHEKALVRQAACIGIGRLGDRALGEQLRTSLTDANPDVRRYAAEAIAKLGYTPAIPDLIMALEANIAGQHILHAVAVLTGNTFGFDPKAALLDRQLAVERAFSWWTAHPELKQ